MNSRINKVTAHVNAASLPFQVIGGYIMGEEEWERERRVEGNVILH